MDKQVKIYIGFLVLLILGIVYIESSKEKDINWYPSYASKHKIPYGTYIFRKELPAFFYKGVQDVYKPPYVFLQDSTKKGTYLFIDGAINFSKTEFYELLNFTKRGNEVFIATSAAFIDTLGIKSEKAYSTTFNENVFVKLVNKQFKDKEYSFDREFSKAVFSKIDTANTTILGQLVIRNKKDSIISKKPNFIKVKHGKGNLYIHLFPEAFTNYGILLNDTNQYTASVISYLSDDKTIFWDAYYKTGKSSIGSPMHYVLNNKSLKWAYYITLIGVLFFIVFKGKRNQRSIPIITPLKNQTLAFTRTIANMYYEKSDHKNIAAHKIDYFLEFIRNKYRISTLEINTEFYQKLAQRSGNTQENIENLFKVINNIQQKEQITKEELLQLNKNIEDFKIQH